ncbi:NADPH dehydrogenase NamA [Virgibacillus alimentarius]|uniref:NADPH2 dehydrogenase n=1 Tax=Virgibacillus alimentarius TaxID=698769 RepID=A0ABS4S6D5_9BACI|nr:MULTISPECIES: NADPH dehydrogenase NamA [Virgibacillus]MBP2256444.1 NADPH2 dehydrogenase [Virgibacillus alimentarius]HLR66389.1 NADPH dehydrogenase NamA [Virgibacillus sp.]
MRKLFSTIEFKGVSLKNRIVMSPMCMYSCEQRDGKITPFHMTHYVSRAVGQVGLIITEATAVQPEGRISPQDLGIWNDGHVEGLKKLNEQIHTYGAKTGIQLAHAGRKAEVDSDIYAPSPLAFDESYKTPVEMTTGDIENTVEAFKNGARRARQANFDIIELHGAHGYLISQFLSPLTNKRTDAYGGNRENRFRFLREIIAAVYSEWGERPLFIRLSTDEYHEAGNTLEDYLYFANQLKALGVDLIDCSSGGVVPISIKPYPGYQVKRCETIKKETSIATGAVGLIINGPQAEEILQNERADLIFIGRTLLRNPYWARVAAEEIRYQIEAPKQYIRGWK